MCMYEKMLREYVHQVLLNRLKEEYCDSKRQTDRARTRQNSLADAEQRRRAGETQKNQSALRIAVFKRKIALNRKTFK